MATTTLTTPPVSTGVRLIIALEAAMYRIATMWRAARNRRSVARLLEWDDRMLRDIGLTHTDVRSAMSLPSGDDPSLHLGALSHERRAAIRAEAHERLGRTRQVRSKSEMRAARARTSINYPFRDL